MPLDPHQLPDIEALRRRTQALAMLEAIVSPECDGRWYSFNAAWGPGEQMASMRNGCGDDWFILFDAAGAAIKGLAHETAAARDPQLAARARAALPATLSSFRDEPAFNWPAMSYCYWREHGEAAWHRVDTDADDGSGEFLALLAAPASAYLDFARDDDELDLPLAGVEAIYAHQPLTSALVRSLNPARDLDALEADRIEIGYPLAAAR
jgi:hypothetical protein